VTSPAATTRAHEPIRPTGPAQVRPASCLIRELGLKLQKCARELHSDFLLGSQG